MFSSAALRRFSWRLGAPAWTALAFLFCSVAEAERLPVKTYTVADGLLRDNVARIKQDSRGFLWFCTVEGISRFDGYAFTNFTTADGLPSRYVNDFLETRGGTIYLATNGGLARLNPSGIRAAQSDASNQNNPLFTVLLPGNARANKINVLFEAENGAVFAGTANGLYKLNERGELELINLGNPLPGYDALLVTSIIKDRRGAMWIGTDNGLIRLLPNGEVEQFNTADGLPDVNIFTLHEDKNGRIWIGLRPNGVFGGLVLLVAEPNKNQNIVERFYTSKDGLPNDWVMDLFEASDGIFWVATTGGLCEWQGGENSVCKTYTGANDLCDGEIWSIAEDKDKNLWMGTRCGLKKWTRHGFTTYTEADGTGLQIANSIFENAAGELFVSFSDGNPRTVSRFDGEKFQLVKPDFPKYASYSGWGNRQTVWQTSAGDWFFPSGGGLFRFPRPARFEDLSKTQAQRIFGTEKTEIFRFFEDSRGDFWVATTGTANELWRWERAVNVWRNLSPELGFVKYRHGTSFVEDRAGNLWIGTGGDIDNTALIRYRDGRFQIFTKAENEMLAGWLHNLFVDGKGRLWMTSTASGLLRLDDVNADELNFTAYTSAEGLSSFGVLCVTEDEFGRIYIGTGRGLDRLTPETGQVENFTTADGLPNSYVELAYRDRKNNLWFGTVNGLARFIPEPPATREPPNIYITGLRIEGVSQGISILGASQIPTLDLNSDQQQIAVDFLGLGTNLGMNKMCESRVGQAARFAAKIEMPTERRYSLFAIRYSDGRLF